MKTVAIPNQSDNYSYLLIDDATQTAAAFDTYDVAKVKSAAEKMGVTISANLTTHHHFDHSGGNEVSLFRLVMSHLLNGYGAQQFVRGRV